MKALFFCIHCNCKAKEIKTTSAVVFLCVLLKGGKTGLAAIKNIYVLLQLCGVFQLFTYFLICQRSSTTFKGNTNNHFATPFKPNYSNATFSFAKKKQKQKITTYQTIIVVCTIFVCRNCKITECNNCKKKYKK